MSNYTQSTNFATKDALSPGDPLKIVRGTEINTEFTNIAVAVATKLDTTALASPGPIGATTPAAISCTSLNGGQLAGLRNRIINGNMMVLQRGTGPVTTNVAGTAFYVADRFFGATLATGAVVAAGNNPNAVLSLSGTQTIFLQTSTAKAVLGTNDYAYLSQYIEGNNVADLKFGTASAKTITISFRARADNIGATAVITVSLRNSANNRAYCTPVTITNTNTNASYSVTIPGDTGGIWLTDTGIGLRVGFGFAGNGTSVASTDSAWVASGAVVASTQTNFLGTATASLNITDVQLEVGPVATPFEQRPYGMELALCQRYYEQITSLQYFTAYANSSAVCRGVLQFATTKRIAPSSVTSSGAFFFNANGTNFNISAGNLTLVTASPDSAFMQGVIAGATAGHGGAVIDQTSSSILILAEL